MGLPGKADDCQATEITTAAPLIANPFEDWRFFVFQD